MSIVGWDGLRDELVYEDDGHGDIAMISTDSPFVLPFPFVFSAPLRSALTLSFSLQTYIYTSTSAICPQNIHSLICLACYVGQTTIISDHPSCTTFFLKIKFIRYCSDTHEK